MVKDSSWMLAFIEDLRDVARDRDLPDLARDLDMLIDRHRPLLAAASAPIAAAEPSGNVVSLQGRRKA